jgi:hypothetical protein
MRARIEMEHELLQVKQGEKDITKWWETDLLVCVVLTWPAGCKKSADTKRARRIA